MDKTNMSFSDKEIFFNYSYRGFFISDEIYTQLSYKKQNPAIVEEYNYLSTTIFLDSLPHPASIVYK